MIYRKNVYHFLYLPLIIGSMWLSSCDTIDLYEKVEAVPKHQWQSSYKPQFAFTIKDTSTAYQLYLIVRHNNKYKYNNIWVNLYAKNPVDSAQKFSLELPLAGKEGWLGSGMDDIFEHRIAFTLDPQRFRFSTPGNYTFSLEQIMRDDPLADVMNVGIRIEKENAIAMAADSKHKLRIATIVYWILLFYVIAALVWWSFSLLQQNKEVHELKKEGLKAAQPAYAQQVKEIEAQQRRGVYKYVGEGSAFLLLIFVGAVFIYRSVRRQFKLQQQQQNFVMAITHELKTPIAVSRLNLETMQKHQLEEEKRKKLLQATLQETLRLDTLINNILISSQLEESAYTISKEELDFSELAKDVVKAFQSRYPDRRISTALEEDVELEGDTMLLKLLLSNLLENANKYSPKEKEIKLQLSKDEATVLLEISDEGCGIPDEEKKAVFQKFYRVGNEQTRTTQGTGLGLYICKLLAKEHSGDILIKDNQPTGSKFIVQFYTL